MAQNEQKSETADETGHGPYEQEKAANGAPRGYDAADERFDEDGNRIYREEAEDAPADREAEKDD